MIEWRHIDVTMIAEPRHTGLTATPDILTNFSPCAGTPAYAIPRGENCGECGIEPEGFTGRCIRPGIMRQCELGREE